MEKIIGLDVGYGFVKVTDGTTGYSFPSVLDRATIYRYSRQDPNS